MNKRIERRAFLAACAAVSASAALGNGIAYGQQTGFATVDVQLDPEPSGRRVLAEFMGLSFEASLIPGGAFFNAGNRALIDYVRGLGSRGVLQFSGQNLNTTTYAPDDLTKLAQFASATGWRILLGLSMTAPVFNVADQAAKATQALGQQLLAFELGNAPDQQFKDYGSFLSAFRARVSSITANAPTATFAGPGTAVPDWIARFAQDERPQIVLLTQQYKHTGAEESLRAGVRNIPKSATITDLPYRIEQIVSDRNNVANALWAIDFAFELAGSGADGANFHDDADGVQQGALYQALQLFKESVGARLINVSLQTAPRNFTAWAVQRDDGTRLITLINRDATVGAAVRVNTGRGNARVRRITGLSTDTTQINPVGWQSADLSNVEVPPASAALITL